MLVHWAMIWDMAFSLSLRFWCLVSKSCVLSGSAGGAGKRIFRLSTTIQRNAVNVIPLSLCLSYASLSVHIQRCTRNISSELAYRCG